MSPSTKPNDPWPDRVIAALANPPTVLWHATTPKKLARYEATGAIRGAP